MITFFLIWGIFLDFADLKNLIRLISICKRKKIDYLSLRRIPKKELMLANV